MARRPHLSPATVLGPLAGLLVAALAAGCSFSWDSEGIRDVLLGGRTPEEIAAGQSSTNADTTLSTDQAAPLPKSASDPAPADEDDDRAKLRRVAVLPVAYLGEGEGQACDLCPSSVVMKPAAMLHARLATGFVYEAVTTHPRLLFPTPDAVDRAMAESGSSMKAAARRLADARKAEVVIVTAIQEMRPRVGPDDAPERPAGVSVYMALVDARSGETLWSDVFDRDEGGRGYVMGVYDRLMNDRPVRWSSAEKYLETAIDDLVDDLIDEVE